jgi:hypothetical protein
MNSRSKQVIETMRYRHDAFHHGTSHATHERAGNVTTHDDRWIGNDTIDSLTTALTDRNGLRRREARRRLVERGREGVDELIRLLKDPRQYVRWEAAKSLGAIADPAAGPALAEALTDSDADVRWLAAGGLIAMGMHGVRPVLERLTHPPLSEELREAAHHVLHTSFGGDMDELLAPVVEAMAGPSPETTVPVAAFRALYRARWRQKAPGDGDY